ncbi:uncharacterized protein [Euwallacea fornicatus]|uniref:uncharacterized protein n=1 Tax=Euwallacea fornicatus TaxID=995702 RepID=UPI0033902C42
MEKRKVKKYDPCPSFVRYIKINNKHKRTRCISVEGFLFPISLDERAPNGNLVWACSQPNCICRVVTTEDHLFLEFIDKHVHPLGTIDNLGPSMMRRYSVTNCFRNHPMDQQLVARGRIVQEVTRKCEEGQLSLRMVTLRLQQLYSLFRGTRLKFKLKADGFWFSDD